MNLELWYSMNSSCFTTHFQTNMKKHTHSFFYSSFIALIELSAAKCSCRFDKFYKTRQKYIEYAIIEAKYIITYEFKIETRWTFFRSQAQSEMFTICGLLAIFPTNQIGNKHKCSELSESEVGFVSIESLFSREATLELALLVC